MKSSDERNLINDIDRLYKEFVDEFHYEPEYANCRIIWRNNYNEMEDVTMKLSADPFSGESEEVTIKLLVEATPDDEIFFYCGGLDYFKSLTLSCNEDFIVIELLSFY